MSTDSEDVVKEARELLARHAFIGPETALRVINALCDEVERLRQTAAQLSRCTTCDGLAVQRLCKRHGGRL